VGECEARLGDGSGLFRCTRSNMPQYYVREVLNISMWLAGIAGALAALALTPVYVKVARSGRIVAQPPAGSSAVHHRPMPTAGGLAICGAVLVVGIALWQLQEATVNSLWPTVTISTGAVAMCVAGLLDDLARLPWSGKMAIQVLAAGAVVAGGVHLHVLALVICLPLSVIWIVGVTNAINLIDGMDGLAAGISALAAAALAAIAFVHGAVNIAILAAVASGASAGFLVYNFYPSATFMGDAGSLFLGFLLATIPLAMVTSTARLSILFAAAIALGIPIFDTLSSMVRRASHRQPVFSGDLGHYYNQLIGRYGLSQRTVALGSYGGGAALAVIAIPISLLPWWAALTLATGVYLAMAMLYLRMGFITYVGETEHSE